MKCMSTNATTIHTRITPARDLHFHPHMTAIATIAVAIGPLDDVEKIVINAAIIATRARPFFSRQIDTRNGSAVAATVPARIGVPNEPCARMRPSRTIVMSDCPPRIRYGLLPVILS